MKAASEPQMCAGCGGSAELAGMGGVWIRPGGGRVAYVLCVACTREFQRDRRAVLDRVEEHIIVPSMVKAIDAAAEGEL